MIEMIRLGEIAIAVTRKDIKHVHLSVHPPSGRVTLVAPSGTRLDVARAYAISKIGWIKRHRQQMQSQARETPRRFVGRETHYLWGHGRLLSVIERDAKPTVILDHQRIRLFVRPGSSESKRREVIHEWHKALLHAAIPPLIQRWERRLDVSVSEYFLQRMKTKWGSCNHRRRHIRINTELVKKPKDLLEYVIVHEMVHLIDSRHSERFIQLMNAHYPTWREARVELNELPVGAALWNP